MSDLTDNSLARAIFTHPTSPKPEPSPAAAVRLVGQGDAGPGDLNALLERAESIYDHPTSKPLPPVEDKPEPKNALASALYGPKAPLPEVKGIPEGIAKLREASKGIYDPAAPYGDAIVIDKSEDGTDPTPEQLAAVNELRLMAADIGIAPVEMQEVATLARTLAATPPTAEQEADWVKEADKRLLDINNQDRDAANKDLEWAKKLAGRDSRVKAILNSTRLGNHPRVIELFVERARAERAAGRLK